MVRITLGQYVAVCPRLQLTSHTQEKSTLSRIKWERYIFIKNETDYISHNTNALGKCMNPIILPPAMGK